MAEMNFILVGRVYDSSLDNKHLVGYWGISLALSCLLVYQADELPAGAKNVIAKAEFDPCTDYTIGQPSDTIYRLKCTEQADILCSQKGTFTLLSAYSDIKHPKIVRLNPSYKYIFSTGFSVSSMRDNLFATSLTIYGDATALLTDDTSSPIIDNFDNQGRKRLLVFRRSQGSDEPIRVPYGVTKVCLKGKFGLVVFPETVELLKSDGACEIQELIIYNKYFAQDILTIDPGTHQNLTIGTLKAENTNVLLLHDYCAISKVICSGEVIDFYSDPQKSPIDIKSNIGRNTRKPTGIVM